VSWDLALFVYYLLVLLTVALSVLHTRRLARSYTLEIVGLKGCLIIVTDAMLAAQHAQLSVKAETMVCRMVEDICTTPPYPEPPAGVQQSDGA
jgi:hypothetical protein